MIHFHSSFLVEKPYLFQETICIDSSSLFLFNKASIKKPWKIDAFEFTNSFDVPIRSSLKVCGLDIMTISIIQINMYVLGVWT